MTEREIEILVAAFHDGELPVAKQRLVAQLLRTNERAADYWLEIKSLRRFLAELPRVVPPATVAELPRSIAAACDVDEPGLDPATFLRDLERAPELLVAEYADGTLSPTQRQELLRRLAPNSSDSALPEPKLAHVSALASLPRLPMPEAVGKAIREAIAAEVARTAHSAAAAPKEVSNAPPTKSKEKRWSWGAVLTAYLDGELPKRRRAMVERALSRSRRGRMFLRHHAQIKLLLGQMPIAQLDKESYRNLIDRAVDLADVPDRPGAIIAAAAETVPSLSHDLPRPDELPATRIPVGSMRGFRWTSYVALAASVVLVLAFAELAFNRTGLLSSPRRLATSPREPLRNEHGVDSILDSKPLEGSLPDRDRLARSRRPADGNSTRNAKSEGVEWLANLDDAGVKERLNGQQIHLRCQKPDEFYNRIYLALRQDGVRLPDKLALADDRPPDAPGNGAMAMQLSLTTAQWRRLFGMLRQMEADDRLVDVAEVTAPSKEVLAALDRNRAGQGVGQDFVIVPKLTLGAGPMANRTAAGNATWRPPDLTSTTTISKNRLTAKQESATAASAGKSSPLPPAENKVRVVVLFEEAHR